ncbi:SDR family NAD(P)-dependent oxidoreductase [Siccirubricoccus phaeus]|uniref:SDR family NAD(P)-dependent oxidoreductase n=1 Tax=Siccirubricoccus phaeus TaxID=2595053 RepID=UPI0011F09DDD|nr:SDR family NAD(P)-dependent oxidoreductase [Siccirubricoccus phaeus]
MTEPGSRTAIVSGAARGIGRAIALALAEKGLAVALVDLREQELAATAAAVRAHGVPALTIAADIADYQAARDHVAAILGAWGRIDVLVNNAAMLQPQRVLEITEAEWDRGMAVNLKGYFNWSQAVAPAMLAQGEGRIINMGSVSAHTGPSPHAASRFAYSATKAGVLGLTRGLARELAPQVCVNAICPGAILTERTAESFAPHLERLRQSTPLGRVGTPEDIAVVAAFLATATPMFMTGEVIDVDGGANIN